MNEDYVDIDASVIGVKKSIKVKATQGAFRRALLLLRDLAAAEVDNIKQSKENSKPTDDEDKLAVTMLESISAQIDLMEKVNQYIIDTLKLNQKQMIALDELSIDDVGTFARSVAGTIMGAKVDEKPTEDDQKSDTK